MVYERPHGSPTGHPGRSKPLWQRKTKEAVVLHSDRGSQFTSHEYQQFLAGRNIICSMSAVGSCYHNAAAESFFGLLKRERVNRRYATRAEARADVFEYIELTYNPRKRKNFSNRVKLLLTESPP